MKKLILSVLLTLAMGLTLLPATALAGTEDSLGTNSVCLRYGGDSVLTVEMPSAQDTYTYGTATGGTATQTSSDAAELPASGWNWAVKKHAPDANGVEYTLIMNNFSTSYISESGLSYGLLFTGKLNLELRGTNTMTDTGGWIWAHLDGNDDLYISGDGELTISGGRFGYTLGVFPTLHVTSGTVKFDSLSANVMHQGGLNITGGTFTASSTDCVFGIATTLTLGDAVAAKASTQADGSNATAYDSNLITTYKWFQSFPAVNAQKPIITQEPADVTYTKGATAEPLTVMATSPDGGTLSYQWSKGNGITSSNIDGATSNTYTPSTDTVGKISYECEVINMINDNGDGGQKIAKAYSFTWVTVTEDANSAYCISLDTTGTHTFTAATVGYAAQTAKTVTVSNTGSSTTGTLTVTLSGTNADSFTLSKNSITDIAVSGNDTFTVVPKTGLSAGTYTATVTVSGGNGITASFDVSFTVNVADGNTPAPHSHSGGTATCKDEAVCTGCGQPYGSKASNNHTGGMEVRGKVDATTTTEGYTGDTYCLGCNTKIATGTTIPKKDSDETSGNTDSGNDGNGVDTPPVPDDEDISPAYVTYTVQSGDTLWAIAKKYSCIVSEIVAANSDLIKNPDLIHVGWQIKIPQAGVTGADTDIPDAILPDDKKTTVYIVKQGDSLWTISKKYGCTIAEIVALNVELITDPDLIYAGWELKILQD